MAAKIKKGDRVHVLTGRDKGKRGEVLRVLPTEGRALVQGINLVKKHTKQTKVGENGWHRLEGGDDQPVEPGPDRPQDGQAHPRRLPRPRGREEGSRGHGLW
jgi:large subunit ribosomal protein L24